MVQSTADAAEAMAGLAAAMSGDSETFELGRARRCYVEGTIEIDEFEQAVERVLKGGTADPPREPYTRELPDGFGGTLTVHGFRPVC